LTSGPFADFVRSAKGESHHSDSSVPNFLRIQDETLLVPIVLLRKGLFCGAVRVGFSTS
jgi:hypothetical protein